MNDPGRLGAMTAVERAIALRHVEAFRAVPIEQLARIAAVAREQTHAEGDVLFHEGQPAGALYVILEGRVGLDRGGERFGHAGSGEALGTWSLFDDQPRRATARVEQDARVLVLDRDDFYDVLADHVELTRSLVQHLVRRLIELTGLAGEEKQ